MARVVHEREDLLRDARALVPRITLRATIDGGEIELFAGFRNESLSVYFGGDPVYHFNGRGELRRAYVDDRLVKAEHGRLVSFVRQRTASASALVRQASEDAAGAMIRELHRRLAELAAVVAAGQFAVVGQVPADGDAVPRLGAWLVRHGAPPIADSPRVG